MKKDNLYILLGARGSGKTNPLLIELGITKEALNIACGVISNSGIETDYMGNIKSQDAIKQEIITLAKEKLGL